MSDYKIIKNKELNSIFNNWSFSKEMQNISRNDMWKQKYGLWAFLSAACDEAALKCYDYINKFASNLIDIDTCNIHSLKSIAESVDLGYLCKNIKEDYPFEILELINLLSIPSQYFIDSNLILSKSSTDLLSGEIVQRTAKIMPDEVSLNLLIDIKMNINQIKNVLKLNLIYPSRKIKRLLKSDLTDLILNSLDDNSEINVTCNEILNNINSIDIKDLQKYTNQRLKTDDGELNWFYLLINVIKQNLYNSEYDFFLTTSYIDKDSNSVVDARRIFGAIINTISTNNKNYINDFICYHFYNLLASKIKNNNLKNMFHYDNNSRCFFQNDSYINEYSLDEFKTAAYEYLNEDEVEAFLNPLYGNSSLIIDLNLNNNLLDFIIYMKLVNNFIKQYNKQANTKIDEIDLNILKIEFPNNFWFKNDNYENILFGKNSVIMKAAKWLTDITLHISYIREQIKTSIQQFNFIGTNRIATDILTDFFIKNYSKEKDWGYISDESFSVSSQIESALFMPLTSLLNPNKNKRFSIEVQEYYDTTEYSNIESDLGEKYVGDYVSRIDESVKYFVDSNNLIASSIISTNVYQEMYLPCSYFINDYNNKFWTSDSTTIFNVSSYLTDETINYENYDNFYSQFDSEYNSLINTEDRKEYIKNELKNLLSTVWNTFALSGFDSSYIGDDKNIRLKYINNDDNKFKYANITNKYFPTISPIQNIDGLIKSSEIDSLNILYLAKIYYNRLSDKLNTYTLNMLKMHDKHGVPYEGWRQSYINFHGYSTNYEYSDNMLSFKASEASKYFDFDGPWSYSLLQQTIFNKLSGATDFSYLLKYIDIENNSSLTLINDIYNYYINNNYLETIQNYKIIKIENDIYDNTFTLFKLKSDNNLAGPIYFRTENMPLSLPLADNDGYKMIYAESSNSNLSSLYYVINNCIDFGVINNIMWVFGKANNDVSYKLFSFNYELKYNRVCISGSTIHEYTHSGLDLYSINDFIGASYNDELRKLNLYTFNSIEAFTKLETQKDLNNVITGDIFNQNLIINDNILSIDTNDISVNSIKVNNALFPSVLIHDERANNEITFDNSHNIWKIEEYDNKYFICYEALNNALPSSIFNYYFLLSSHFIKFETIRFSFDILNYSRNITSIPMSYSLSININSIDEQCNILLHKNIDNENAVNLIYNEIIKYPKCSTDKTHLYIDLIPLSFMEKINEVDMKNIISKVLKYWNENKTIISFSNMLNNIVPFINTVDEKIINKLQSYLEYTLDLVKNNMKNIISTFDTAEQYNSNTNSNTNLNNSYLINDIYSNIPVLTKCINDKIKIIVWFKNPTETTFIGDYALDLDLTCYIDTYEDKNNKVGYRNNYKSTKYISWEGDVTKGDYEYLEINTARLKSDKYNDSLSDLLNTIKINLNLCWHNTSEIKHNDVYISVFYENIKQDIPINLVNISDKACQEKSIVISYNMKTNTINYEIPNNYLAVKLTMKHELCEYSDGIPDIQVGVLNMVESEWLAKQNSEKWNDFGDYLIYIHGYNKFKHFELKYNYITILFKNLTINTSYDRDIYPAINKLMDEVFTCSNLKPYNLTYSKICLNDIFFGYLNNNLDADTGIKYSYYSFLRKDNFKEQNLKKYNCPILKALDSNISNNIIKIQGDY